MEGRAQELAATVHSLLQVRGLPGSPAFPERAAALIGTPRDTVMAAAYACADEADFWRRLGASRTLFSPPRLVFLPWRGRLADVEEAVSTIFMSRFSPNVEAM